MYLGARLHCCAMDGVRTIEWNNRVVARGRRPFTPYEALAASRLDELAKADVSYDEIGATLSRLPKGYRHVDRAVELHGADAFAETSDDLRDWLEHRAAGLHVFPEEPPLAVGTDVLVTMRFGPVAIEAPCRIVAVVDEADRFGFAYGTLPGHPYSGEELFVVERLPDGRVFFRIRAFSHPALGWSKMLAIPGAFLQDRATRRYLRAIAEA